MANQKLYVKMVVDILKKEGLYKVMMSDHQFTEINRRISHYYIKNTPVYECAARVAQEVFNKVN
jgi:hypothetical protein